MSISNDAQVTILLADFANVDGQGKINAVGAGITNFMMGPGAQATSPFAVVVVIMIEPKHVGSDYAFSLELHDITRGHIAKVGGGPGGQMQPLRAQQSITVEPFQVQAPFAKPDHARAQNIIAMNFPTGLPLQPGTYEWKVSIDTQTRQQWRYRFHVLGPAPGIVFGGPDNPPDIPGVGTYTVEPPERAESDEPEKGTGTA